MRKFYKGLIPVSKIPPNGQLLTLTLCKLPEMVDAVNKQSKASSLHHNWLEIKQKTNSTNGLIPFHEIPYTDVGAYKCTLLHSIHYVAKIFGGDISIPKRSLPFI
ncbi:hypothetical protein H6G26_19855 [Nostoc sp. FACHB-888]|nr:hypothetical protein [Nostoc sp. FACHB-888]